VYATFVCGKGRGKGRGKKKKKKKKVVGGREGGVRNAHMGVG
jgi:hypothetical protein